MGEKHRPLRWLIAAAVAVAVTVCCCLTAALIWRQAALSRTEPENKQEQTAGDGTESGSVTVGGQTVEIDPELESNTYVEADFAVTEDGVVYLSGEARYGIDVSAHQGEINWAAVAADGVDFAIIRAAYRGYTQGGLNEDSYFRQNIAAALENGIEVGVYVFSQAVSAEEAEEEARFVLELISDYDIAGPVVYDWEPMTDRAARTDGVTGEELTAFALAFCQVAEEAGYTPMLYLNGSLGYLYYDLSRLQNYEVWYADYGEFPVFAYALSIWQWTNTGTVDGVSGDVDRNIWFQ